MPEPLPSPRPTPWPVPAPPPSPGPWVGAGGGGASRSTPGVVCASAGAEAIGATMVVDSSGSRGFSIGAGGGSSRAGSGLLSEWCPSRCTLGGGAFCRRPPPPPPPPGSGQREEDERDRLVRHHLVGRARRPEATSQGWQRRRSPAPPARGDRWRPAPARRSARAPRARRRARTACRRRRWPPRQGAWTAATAGRGGPAPRAQRAAGPAIGTQPRAARSSTTAWETRAAEAISARRKHVVVMARGHGGATLRKTLAGSSGPRPAPVHRTRGCDELRAISQSGPGVATRPVAGPLWWRGDSACPPECPPDPSGRMFRPSPPYTPAP